MTHPIRQILLESCKSSWLVFFVCASIAFVTQFPRVCTSESGRILHVSGKTSWLILFGVYPDRVRDSFSTCVHL